MHYQEASFSTVPAFLTKLWSLVEDLSTNDLIYWDISGKSFHVSDQTRFAKEILPLYFKHNNIASFIRQLNMYGFRKVINTDAMPLKSEKEDLEFAHQYFIRDREELLENIKRKTSNQNQIMSTLSKKDVSTIMEEVSSLKSQIDTMTDTLEILKVENELLWKEIVDLRQKHTRQHQVVSKLLQFFASFMNERNQSMIRRKLPLMIKDSQEEEPNLVDKETSAKKAIMSQASSGNNSTDLLDFQSFQLNPGQIYQDASINNSDKQLLNELVSKPEQRLYFKDINKDSITKNIDSFQNSLDSLSDYFSFSPYTFDNGISFEGGTSDDSSKKDDDDGEADGEDDAIAAKKQKLSEGKEIIQYTSPEDFFFNMTDLNSEFIPNTEKNEFSDSLSLSSLYDLEMSTPAQWSPKPDS